MFNTVKFSAANNTSKTDWMTVALIRQATLNASGVSADESSK